MSDPFERFKADVDAQWLSELRLQFLRPWPVTVITNLDDGRTLHEIMEDLRRDDPDGHALLSEHLVIEP